MAHVRDSDTALWLHNKLGSAEELWLPSSISGIIKTTTIDNIYRCFTVLTTTVKLKLLLGVLHLPRRNLEEMKHTIEGIIELALDDSDLWVKLVAGIIKTYPMTFNLNLDLRSSSIAKHVLQQVAEKVKAADTISSLPLECQYVNKTALQSLVGNLPPVKRHFSLLKRPKSAALRTELLHKCDEAVSQLKKGGVGMGSKTVPVKHRDMARRSSDVGPMKRIPTKATMTARPDVTRSMSTATQSTSQSRSLARSSRPQAGGTKLLDISEQPIGGSGISARDSKRRKKLLQLQDVNASQQPEEEVTQEKPPEYAVGLESSIHSESAEDVPTPMETTSENPPSVVTTPRRSTAESTEQDMSSEEEKTPQIEVEIQPTPTTAPPISAQAAAPPQPTMPSPALPATTLVTASNVRMLSPRTISVPISDGPPTVVYAIPTTLQSSRTDVAQANKTMYRMSSPPSNPVKSPEQRLAVPLHQVQVIRQLSPSIRQITPPRMQQQQQPTSVPTMRSPIVVQKFQSPPAGTSSSASPGTPVLFQQRTQSAVPLFLSGRMVSAQRLQQIPVAQNLTNSPATLVIRQQTRPINQQQPQLQQQQQPQLQQQQQQQSQQQQRRQQFQQQMVQQKVQQQSPVRALTFVPRVQSQQASVQQTLYQARIPQQVQRLQTPQQIHPQRLQQTISRPPQQPQQQQQQAYIKPQVAGTAPPKHGLTLTREQMYEAQELFRDAPKLTRPEKAMIIGFIAGNRENPYPEQGNVIRFVLSEQLQHVQNTQSGGVFPVIVETVLELNYNTGKLTKIPRYKAANQQMVKT